ncbi:unnamed protein product [Cylicocyclus nassatus]|uniref:Costars domain-containing protein n=1 Tax=Cylicocyclus nassatus TaxID=53992 RepID=A0AA36GWG3_CYLNA|nr:unnamed protein product [Cylicocyclus nassatus]
MALSFGLDYSGGAKINLEKAAPVKPTSHPLGKYENTPRHDKNDPNYGRPLPGSLSEAKGIKASLDICREVLFLMEIINENAEGEEPHKWIKFGKLFHVYSLYSDSVVGYLIRARKYGLVHFEGEMLFQRQDDEKKITMQMAMADIRERLQPTGDPKNCIAIVAK